MECETQIVFEKASSLGRGEYIRVKEWVKLGPKHPDYKKRQGRPILVEIGWIGCNSADGKYRYFEPYTNELNPTFVDDSLDILKEKIKTHRKKKKG